MPSGLETQLEIARRICTRARLEVARRLDSRTLRNALNCVTEQTAEAEVTAILSVPHYWAIYYHDGRGTVRARKGKFLVWFRSIEDDPRSDGGKSYPVRESDVRPLRLTKSQFVRLLKSGKLIMSKRSGPTQGKPFMRVLRGLNNRVGDITGEELSKFVLTSLEEDGSLNFKGTIGG